LSTAAPVFQYAFVNSKWEGEVRLGYMYRTYVGGEC
jgi:hypothetical protein